MYQTGPGNVHHRPAAAFNPWPGCRLSGSHHGDMPHFAAGAGLGPAVDMDGGARNRQPVLVGRRFRPRSGWSWSHAAEPPGRGERPAGDGPDMLLELRHRTAVQCPVAGIADTRRHLVDQDLGLGPLAPGTTNISTAHAPRHSQRRPRFGWRSRGACTDRRARAKLPPARARTFRM